ncbi:hypothetical protein M2410_002126 [Stenotrophomonas chelatiphaga]|nr:hypothetical protein [Stenotrophomonas chelatiphaga]MCS4231392.1 hypothetical protein [Stenotrophomonas chelatiphaga]
MSISVSRSIYTLPLFPDFSCHRDAQRLREKIGRLFNFEHVTGGQAKCLSRHTDCGRHDSFVKSRHLRRAEVVHEAGVLSANLAGFYAQYISQALSLIPRHRAVAAGELGNETGGDVEQLRDSGLREARLRDGFSDGEAFCCLGIGGSGHVSNAI